MTFTPRLPDPRVNLPDVHPLRELAVLLVAVATLGAAVVVASAYLVDLVVALVPPATEMELAGSWGSLPAGDEGCERCPSLEALLAELQEPQHPYTHRISVIDRPEPNAFALPGGAIWVTRGLLDEAESENEIAFVLAHELGHFVHRDHLRALGRRVALALLMASLGLSGDAPQALGAGGTLAELSYSRGQERAADAYALERVAQHYGHVAGGTAFFERLAAGPDAPLALGAFLRTHPGAADRAARMRELAGERGLATEGALRPPL